MKRERRTGDGRGGGVDAVHLCTRCTKMYKVCQKSSRTVVTNDIFEIQITNYKIGATLH